MPNRLAAEASPYLLQHARNPVEWYPWGPEAFSVARALDRPLLLSIGYSACHWCHVMAQECFDDAQVAATMNRLFVCVKVDREERPDIDQIYQLAHGLITRRNGGWPLTMFLTPAQQPFYAGTYFPKVARGGLPAFSDLLERVAEVFATRRGDVTSQAAELVEALQRRLPRPDAATSVEGLAARAVQELAGSFDSVHGGFGAAPKFPHPAELALCLLDPERTGAATMTERTLLAMTEGGLFDHLGGGFFRYSVDASWTIPHFEKMLADNALLLPLAAECAQRTQSAEVGEACRRTVAWVLRDMQGPGGGFYASVDADSELGEGEYYLWQRAEVEALLEEPTRSLVVRYFGLDLPENFDRRRFHLRCVRPLPACIEGLGLDLPGAWNALVAGMAVLARARAQRAPPAVDRKVLTAWNALMIRGLARASRLLGEPGWIAPARRALECLRRELWRDGRLLAVSCQGRAYLEGYLDDHAFLIEALLEL